MFCPHCGADIGDGHGICPSCLRNRASSAQETVLREPTAWERRQEAGAVQGLLTTMRESLFSPSAFFQKMPVSGGLVEPTLYAMITGTAGMTLLALWQVLFQNAVPMAMPDELGGSGGVSLLVALMIPFIIVVNVHLWAGMLHALLVMMGGVSFGYEATFRVSAYSYGAMILLGVPFCGWPVAAVWSMVLAIIGLKKAQGASGQKAALSVLFPLLFCCAATALVMMLVFGTIAASLGAMTPHSWK